MKYLKLFEHYASETANTQSQMLCENSESSSLDEMIKLIGGKAKTAVTIIEIPDLPEALKYSESVYKIVFYHETGIFRLSQMRNPQSGKTEEEMTKAFIEDLKDDVLFESKYPNQIFNVIEIERVSSKGVSDPICDWLWAEVNNGKPERSWKEVVEDMLKDKKSPDPEDNDFKILGIDKEKWRGVLHGKKFGL